MEFSNDWAAPGIQDAAIKAHDLADAAAKDTVTLIEGALPIMK